MPVVIKEIKVNTVVEKRVALPEEISSAMLDIILEHVRKELSADASPHMAVPVSGKRER